MSPTAADAAERPRCTPGSHLSLVPETLETRLIAVLVALRTERAQGVLSADLDRVCRRDAIAVLDAGRIAGLMR